MTWNESKRKAKVSGVEKALTSSLEATPHQSVLKTFGATSRDLTFVAGMGQGCRLR